MKKQFLTAILIFSMALSFCACGSINNGSSDEQGGVENSEDYIKEAGTDDEEKKANADPDEETLKAERPDWLSHLYEDPFFDWSIWITNIDWKAAGYGYQCRGTLEQEWETEHIYLTEYCGEVGDDRQLEEIDLSQYQSSEDIFDVLAPNFNHGIFLGSSFKMQDYTYEILETKEINGVQMTKFEGTMEVLYDSSIEGYDEYYTYPFVAYGIAAKHTPVLLTCIDRSEGSVYHEEWVSKIDEMVATFQDAAE